MAGPDPYLTPTEVRSRQPDLTNPTSWPNALLEELVESFETKIEDALEVAFRVRTRVITTHCADGVLVLPSILVDPTSVEVLEDPTDPTGTAIDSKHVNGPSGIIRSPLVRGHVHVRYDHGHTDPPAVVLQACALYVWHEAKAQRSPSTNNSYMRYDAESGAMERISTADPSAGRITGWQDVDRLLSGLRPIPLGFA